MTAGTRDGDGPRTVLASAPKEIDRMVVLGELIHRFERANPNNAIAWVLDELIELDILKNREPALCAEIEGATGIRCQQPSGHVGGHKGTSTEEQTAAVGYPLFVSWPGETVVVTSDARRSVGVVNEPHGLSTSLREEIARLAAAGHRDDAVDLLVERTHLNEGGALAYVEGMSEYQSYLSEHGPHAPRRVLVVAGAAPEWEPDPEVKVWEWLGAPNHDNYRFVHRVGDGYLWDTKSEPMARNGSAPNTWYGATRSCLGEYREVRS